eukprot:CAMPEP_0172418464 /NCGR_PEP_ID=MMETSP1064-20121228/4943_1 /TAXON_ID=202472 /ORGANISM="Aulacoseira subarctica , Strain CCAP 1002/5" /LENGTH=527 /DNA_ID=CAMNT_0013157409 /DNA_START=99 /DNA_END=1682 /DNA_ORIENTATION=+
MAWRSSGSNNEEMVDNLKKFGAIRSPAVEQAFRSVDRKHFLPPGLVSSAHSDVPLKEGNIHISAPHIYGAVVEALDLESDSCQTFLNIGSGTGYLSSIVAEILGIKSLNYGIEIHPDVVEHSKMSIDKWFCARRQLQISTQHSNDILHLQIIHGNGLHVDSAVGEAIAGFDRIYVGAALDDADLSKVTVLLAPNGILVAPVDDDLIKITRIEHVSSVAEVKEYARKRRVHYNTLDVIEESNGIQFSRQVITGVRFAPLLHSPAMTTVLPARIWSPKIQKCYSKSFQKATLELLMCSNSQFQQPPPAPQKTDDRINIAAVLPKVLWLEILSFTHRRWFDFDPIQDETKYLKNRIIEEQRKAARALQAHVEAEKKCRRLERERDFYRILARRWESRDASLLQRRLDSDNNSLHETRANASIQEASARFGLDALLQHSMTDQSVNESSDNDTSRESERQDSVRMDDFSSADGSDRLSVGSRTPDEPGSDDEEMSFDYSSSLEDFSPSSQQRSRFSCGIQPRSVSIGHDEL